MSTFYALSQIEWINKVSNLGKHKVEKAENGHISRIKVELKIMNTAVKEMRNMKETKGYLSELAYQGGSHYGTVNWQGM